MQVRKIEQIAKEASMDAIVQRAAAGSADVKHAIVIVGGGAAGITVAAKLKRHDPSLDIATASSAASKPNDAKKN